jgi:hypothetical protein
MGYSRAPEEAAPFYTQHWQRDANESAFAIGSTWYCFAPVAQPAANSILLPLSIRAQYPCGIHAADAG